MVVSDAQTSCDHIARETCMSTLPPPSEPFVIRQCRCARYHCALRHGQCQHFLREEVDVVQSPHPSPHPRTVPVSTLQPTFGTLCAVCRRGPAPGPWRGRDTAGPGGGPGGSPDGRGGPAGRSPPRPGRCWPGEGPARRCVPRVGATEHVDVGPIGSKWRPGLWTRERETVREMFAAKTV